MNPQDKLVSAEQVEHAIMANIAGGHDRNCLLQTIASLPAFNAWRDIASAPKDGTAVVTCIMGELYPVDVKVNHYNDPTQTTMGIGSKGWWESAPNRQPTHFYSLPPFSKPQERSDILMEEGKV